MSKLHKKISITLLVTALLLVSAISALAAGTPFTLVGELDYVGGIFKVGTQEFVVILVAPDATACTDDTGLTIACTSLVDGSPVEVIGTYAGTPAVYTASSVAVLGKYQGVLITKSPLKVDADPTTVEAEVFDVNPDTDFPVSYSEGDTVEVTYKAVGLTKLAYEVKLVSSGQDIVYTYEGLLSAFDSTTWTVGDYTFNIEDVTLPIYFGYGDKVLVTFKITAEGYIATEVEILETFVPIKTESARCVDRVGSHPGVRKIAEDVGADYKDILALFCKGFGLGEIKLAYRYAQGSMYSPEMLLALRAQGMGWGELKKMAGNNPGDEEPGEVEEGSPGDNGRGHEKNNNGTPENLNKPDNPNKPENPGNSGKDKDNNGKAKGKNK
jgi:hypothetical protein